MNLQISASSILTSQEVAKVYELGGYTKSRQFELLYRATRDGFGAAAFHSKCDNHANTLTVVKSSLGFVFGGFTSQLWNNCTCYRSDAAAYLLNLRRSVPGFNVATDARRFDVTATGSAILAYNVHGPLFGGGYDFYISGMSNMNAASFSRFGYSYQLPSGYTFMTIEASSYLAGCSAFADDACYFSTSEIEVFKLI